MSVSWPNSNGGGGKGYGFRNRTYLLHECEEDDQLEGDEFGKWLVVFEVLL